MSEVLDRLTALENRVASLKDWKQKYEEDKRKWDEEKGKLEKGLDGVQKLREALAQFLALDTAPAATPAQSTKETLNLSHKELIVNLAHEEREVNMTTSTVVGKVLFCALTELKKDGFTEAELSEALKEHGWNHGHSTLAPTLGGLVKEGHLIRLDGKPKPTKYRLPTKLKLNVSEA